MLTIGNLLLIRIFNSINKSIKNEIMVNPRERMERERDR